MTTHTKPFVFFGSLFLYSIYFFGPSVFVCVFPVSLWMFHQTSTGLPLNTPKKTLQGQGRLCVKCPQKSFLFELVRLFFCHHKFFLVSFLSVIERVSEARSDWRLRYQGERERQRYEPGYEEDVDSAQANTNHIHAQPTND